MRIEKVKETYFKGFKLMYRSEKDYIKHVVCCSVLTFFTIIIMSFVIIPGIIDGNSKEMSELKELNEKKTYNLVVVAEIDAGYLVEIMEAGKARGSIHEGRQVIFYPGDSIRFRSSLADLVSHKGKIYERWKNLTIDCWKPVLISTILLVLLMVAYGYEDPDYTHMNAGKINRFDLKEKAILWYPWIHCAIMIIGILIMVVQRL